MRSLAVPSFVCLVGWGSMASAFTAAPFLTAGTSLSRRQASASLIRVTASSEALQADDVGENPNVQLVSSSPRWPGDKELWSDEVYLRPKLEVPKVEKKWTPGVPSRKGLENEAGRFAYFSPRLAVQQRGKGAPQNVQFPANLFAQEQALEADDLQTVTATGGMAEAKQSAGVLALLLLLSQPILYAGYYSVQTDQSFSDYGFVAKRASIGEFKETTGDTLNRYVTRWADMVGGVGATGNQAAVPTSYYQSLKTRDEIATPRSRAAKERADAEVQAAKAKAEAAAKAAKAKTEAAAKASKAKAATPPAAKAATGDAPKTAAAPTGLSTAQPAAAAPAATAPEAVAPAAVPAAK